MFNRREIFSIIIVSVVLAFGITLAKDLYAFLLILLGVFIVILINTFAKKITGFYLDSKVEVRIWEFRRYGFKPEQRSRQPIPAGLIIPLLSKIILFPLNGFLWMASMVFDVNAKKYKAARRHGIYSFSEITEDQIGIIAASGIIFNLIACVIFYMVGLPLFAKLNIWFVFFNMLPISDLDGNKIFFGNNVLWVVLAIISLIALGYTFLLI
jgi:Zn-dependent protease